MTENHAARFDWLGGIDLVDAHHHFWQLDRFPYRWLAPGAPPARFGDKRTLQRDFLPKQYLAAMHGAPLQASVHVQANCGADDPVDETKWLQSLSETTGWPSAAVAEIDLTDEKAVSLIDRHRQYSILRGVRTPVAWDEHGRWRVASRPDVITEPQFQTAARHLTAHNLGLECVIIPRQLQQVAEFAQAHPDLSIIINHFATLELDQPGTVELWHAGIANLAAHNNVFVKVSGLWTADKGWSAARLKPFVAHLLDSVGAGRVMWGSNLPVESVNCPLPQQFEQLKHMLSECSHRDLAQIFGGTARRVYRV